MMGTKGASRVQWMWRLLFSALLCVPAIFMLVVGAWNDRPIASPEPRYGSDSQLYSSTGAAPAISLSKEEAGPVVAGAGQSETALNIPAPVNPPTPGPQRSRGQRPKVELWYATTPKQEAPTFLHWRLTTRPGVWIPGANQDSGG